MTDNIILDVLEYFQLRQDEILKDDSTKRNLTKAITIYKAEREELERLRKDIELVTKRMEYEAEQHAKKCVELDDYKEVVDAALHYVLEVTNHKELELADIALRKAIDNLKEVKRAN